MISRFKKSAVSKTSFIALLGLFIGFHSSIAFAQPKAGSNITNIASGDFEQLPVSFFVLGLVVIVKIKRDFNALIDRIRQIKNRKEA